MVMTPVTREHSRQGLLRFWSRNRSAGVSTLSVLIFLLFWELVARLSLVDPTLTSFPTEILERAVELTRDGSLAGHLKTSGYEFLVGFGAALVIGIPGGMLLGSHRLLDDICRPFMSALYATPRLALTPLLIVWLGIGLLSKMAVIFLVSVFPLIINAYEGVRNADPQLLRLARSFGAGGWMTATRVVLPGTVPYLVAGVRLGIGQGLIGVYVAELIAARQGIGFMITQAGNNFQTDIVFVGVAVFSALGAMMNWALGRVEARFSVWRTSN